MATVSADESAGLFFWTHRPDDLTAQVAGLGAVATGMSLDPTQLLAALGGRVPVVDARAMVDEALAVAATFGTSGGAMLVLLSENDLSTLGRFLDAGATHFLSNPWTPEAFTASLRCVARHGQRTRLASTDPLAINLQGAIARGEVDVLFQPQVAMATGAIVGVEALARWEHPTLGVLGAEPLFAAAERAGVAAALSDHVQTLALARAAAWPESLGGLRLSVNVTAADLARVDFATRFLDRVRASGFPVARVTAEITESGLIAELGTAAHSLATLRAAGCRVAIDDFGTGYSSLAYLQALPLDYLKIDKALTQDIVGTARDRVIVRAVIGMARALGLTVIAEGVETAEQRDLLAADGCELYQGFLCAEPLDGAALERLMENGGGDG